MCKIGKGDQYGCEQERWLEDIGYRRLHYLCCVIGEYVHLCVLKAR